MSDWQKLVSTTIKSYIDQKEAELLNSRQILDTLRGGLPAKPYVAPPDTRTEAQKIRERRANCRHEFARSRMFPNRGRACLCKKCGLIESLGWVRGYKNGYSKGQDDYTRDEE